MGRELAEDPEIREEDYAAGMMAVQNIALAAAALGLGTHIKTGAVMQDPAARAAIGVGEGQRVIAMLNVGSIYWGDGGRLYLLIRPDDLAAGDFWRVRVVLGCS